MPRLALIFRELIHARHHRSTCMTTSIGPLSMSSLAMGEKQRRQAGSLQNANHSLARSMSLHGVPRANEQAACVTPFNRLGVFVALQRGENRPPPGSTRASLPAVSIRLFFPPRRILITTPRNHPPFTWASARLSTFIISRRSNTRGNNFVATS